MRYSTRQYQSAGAPNMKCL